MKKSGLIPDGEIVDGISKQQLEFVVLMLKSEFVISSIKELNDFDPRFSSPEKTCREIYKKALSEWDLKLASRCHLPRNYQI